MSSAPAKRVIPLMGSDEALEVRRKAAAVPPPPRLAIC